MKIGIIGHAEDKFTISSKEKAMSLIKSLLINQEDITLVSGHCPLGGIDIWAENLAVLLGDITLDLKIPKQYKWDAEYGFKQRNIDIAKCSDVLHIILVDKYPPNYQGMVFKECYHCHTNTHVKSGACWTGNVAKKLGKEVIIHIIRNE